MRNLPANADLMVANTAFSRNSELTDLVIPDSLTSIRFFIRIESDGTVYEVSIAGGDIPDSFQGCQKLPIRTRQRLQELGYQGEF